MEIDIIGIGLRFPNIRLYPDDVTGHFGTNSSISGGDLTTVDAFWDLLQSRRSAIGPMPAGRWEASPYLDANSRPGKTITFNAGWLNKIDRFDYSFFNLSKREACEMDPQQRLVLEVACEALHDAGISPQSLAQTQNGPRTGVFVGAGMAEYQSMSFGAIDDISRHTMSGNSLAVIANRLSFYFDLDGPSLTVDTACSAAMTAFTLACQSIQLGECDQAIVSGVNTMLGPSPFVGFAQANMLSPRGICAPFDESADGFARGEGCGVVILRRTSEDHGTPYRSYAKVLGCGMNEDGRTASLTMPSEDRQKRLYINTLKKACIVPDQIVYVEAHGTGTPVGDPIEAKSIATALSSPHRKNPLAIGSVKGHIGHLETAAGIAGLIKAALCLHHKQLVPTANHFRLSPNIDGTKQNIRVPNQPEPLPSTGDNSAAAVGICSYGFGGANGFAILGEATPQGPDDGEDPMGCFATPLSAHKPEYLDVLKKQYEAIPYENKIQAGRWAGAILPQKRYRYVKITEPEGQSKLNLVPEPLEFQGQFSGKSPRLLFAFSGQGSQIAEMGVALYERFPQFRKHVDAANELFSDLLGRSLIKEHGFCQTGGISPRDQRDVTIAMPCVVMLQVGLVKLLESAGIRPSIVIGHSTGEMTAGWQRGALTLEELAKLVSSRAKAQALMPPGAMLALGCGASDAQNIINRLDLDGSVCVAASNSANQVTISGEQEAVERILSEAIQNNLIATRLAVKRAFHSHHTHPILGKLGQDLAMLHPCPAHTPMISSVVGLVGPLNGEAMGANYWIANVRKPVDFLGACQQASSHSDLALEIAPRKTLKTYLTQNLAAGKHRRGKLSHECISVLETKGAHDRAFLACCADLYTRGVPVDWAALQPPTRFFNVPRIPWDHTTPLRSQVWRTPIPAEQKGEKLRVGRTNQLKLDRGSARSYPPAHTESADSNEVPRLTAPESNEISLDVNRLKFLEKHKIEGNVVMPGAGFLGFALLPNKRDSASFSELRFDRFLVLQQGQAQRNLTREVNNGRQCWRYNGRTVFSCAVEEEIGSKITSVIDDIPHPNTSQWKDVNVLRFRHAVSEHSGLHLDGAFKSLKQAKMAGVYSQGQVICSNEIIDPESVATILLDGAMQTLALHCGIDSVIFAPVSITQFNCDDIRKWPYRAKTYAKVTQYGAGEISGDIELRNQDDLVLATLGGVKLKALPSKKSLQAETFQLVWQKIGRNFSASREDALDGADNLVVPVSSLRDAIGAAITSRGSVRILDASVSGIAQVELADATNNCPKELPQGSIFIASMSTVSEQASNLVHALDAEKTQDCRAMSILRPRSFDFVVTSSKQLNKAKHFLLPTGKAIMTDPSDAFELRTGKEIGFRDSVNQKPKSIYFFGTLAMRWMRKLSSLFEVTDTPENADIIVDTRDDIVAASRLVNDLERLPRLESVIFFYCDAPASSEVQSPSSKPLEVSMAPGFARAARNEVKGIPIYSVGFEHPCDDAMIGAAMVEFLSDAVANDEKCCEFEWRYGPEGWTVPRLLAFQPAASSPVKYDYRLDIGDAGQLQSLRWRPFKTSLETLSDSEIRIDISHVSLHFKDVLLAMGLLDSFDPIMGMECCGIITDIGVKVPDLYPDLKLGSSVLCMSMTTNIGSRKRSLFGTSAVVDARCAIPKPEGIDRGVAAGFLGVYSTAWHALLHRAQLKAGETVLIHSAAGGVGLSAIQIATQLGANVIASAGNEQKRQFLRIKCGIKHVIDSHKPENFVAEIHQLTEGLGVDVTLNSLAGEGLKQTLKSLAPAGRHVEIGKRDILEDNSLNLLLFKNNISFHSVHLDILDESHPGRVQNLIRECANRLACGQAYPVSTTIYPYEKLYDAFRHLSSGKHCGKIIVSLENLAANLAKPSSQKSRPSAGPQLYPVLDALFAENEIQLITGGLGGFGLALARFLLSSGARRIVLASRNPPDGIAVLKLEGLRRAYPSAEIRTLCLDVTDRAAVARLFDEEKAITGIFHAATNYDAQAATKIDDTALDTWNTKVLAAQYLDQCSRNRTTRYFVLFTSLAGLHGNTGQATYVAANAALHDLARHRRASNLTAMAIDLPVMLGAGRLSDPRYVAELQHNTGKGFHAVSYRSLLPIFAQLWAEPEIQPPVVCLDHPQWESYVDLNRNISMFETLIPRHENTINRNRV